MIIVHIAYLKNRQNSGVDVVVPKYLIEQQQSEDVALINIGKDQIKGVKNQFIFSKDFDFSIFPVPFNNPDIVVFHEVYRPAFLKIYPNLVKNNIPYIIIPHVSLSKEAQKQKWLKKKIANTFLFNRFINCASTLQFLSENEQQSSNTKNRKSIIIPNGIDLIDYKHSFNAKKITFTYIGRFSMYHKGLDLLLDAIFELKQEQSIDSSVQFNLYGPSEEDYSALKQLIKNKNLGDVINIYDAVFGESKKDVLNSAIYFIQTSRFEGMPLGVLEALSYGVPCCLSDGTGLASFVKENNAGFSSNNTVSGIKNMILEAIHYYKSGDLELLSVNAQRNVLENFSWREITNITIEKYKEILEFSRNDCVNK